MFAGHHAVGLASKRFAPGVSLGLLMAAPLLLDLVWPVLVLLGVEWFRIDPGNTAVTPLAFDHYPWSHGLVPVAALSLLYALGVLAATRSRAGAVVSGLGVLSHWLLDAATHAPDLPLGPWGGPKVGLGLWNSVAGTALVEGALFAAGIVLYARATRPLDRVGRWGFVGYVVLVGLIWVAALQGTPPPSTGAVAWLGLTAWLFPFWAAWFDRHRGSASPADAP